MVIKNPKLIQAQAATSNQTNQNQHPPAIDFFLPREEVKRQSGYSIASIYRLMAAGKFPHPVKTGGRAVRWRQSDITAWQLGLQTTDQLKG